MFCIKYRYLKGKIKCVIVRDWKIKKRLGIKSSSTSQHFGTFHRGGDESVHIFRGVFGAKGYPEC